MQGPSYTQFIPQQPSAPPAPPTLDDPAAKEAARKQAAINAGLMGRGSTLLFGAAQPDPQRRGASMMMGSNAAMGT